tara:strand:- start:6975 stop:7082 length:108 start_codon:yes stop_codon:yes gene_type:complete
MPVLVGAFADFFQWRIRYCDPQVRYGAQLDYFRRR